MNRLGFFSLTAALGSSWAFLLSSPAFASNHLLLYGGQDHNIFLGCFTCHELNPDSISNEIGRYGSEVSPTSIFNKVGRYGSQVSNESVCNPRASYPPVVVDEAGDIYGYLTVNLSARDAIQIPQLQGLVMGICR
ncbi:hypothetical protein NDI44_17865 [Trichocoleus sp. DQ-A3]|uniref:hypothetical protein n=1 Tax=Trichocoleus sp. DQ-A3 TaxID=2933925 RepID=UPI003298022B